MDAWDENNVWSQAQLIAYDQIRQYEETQDKIELYKFLGAQRGASKVRRRR